MHQRFARVRRGAIAAITGRTKLVVRGCEFGNSQKGMDALRVLLGGKPMVVAPTAFQGYAVQNVGGRFGKLFEKPHEAFNHLLKAGRIPVERVVLRRPGWRTRALAARRPRVALEANAANGLQTAEPDG